VFDSASVCNNRKETNKNFHMLMFLNSLSQWNILLLSVYLFYVSILAIYRGAVVALIVWDLNLQ